MFIESQKGVFDYHNFVWRIQKMPLFFYLLVCLISSSFQRIKFPCTSPIFIIIHKSKESKEYFPLKKSYCPKGNLNISFSNKLSQTPKKVSSCKNNSKKTKYFPWMQSMIPKRKGGIYINKTNHFSHLGCFLGRKKNV